MCREYKKRPLPLMGQTWVINSQILSFWLIPHSLLVVEVLNVHVEYVKMLRFTPLSPFSCGSNLDHKLTVLSFGLISLSLWLADILNVLAGNWKPYIGSHLCESNWVNKIVKFVFWLLSPLVKAFRDFECIGR